MAVLNGMKWLPEQVDSILKQRDVETQLIVSVDRSTDGSEEWCRVLATSDERVILLPTGEHFGSASANFYHLLSHVDTTRYTHIALADQDDIWQEDKLFHATHCLRLRNCSGYSSNVEAVWPDGRHTLINKAQPQCVYDYLFEAAGPGCTYVFTQDLASKIQKKLISHPVKRINFHDWFCYAVAKSQNFEWHIDPESRMQYRQHSNNVLGINSGLNAFKRRARHAISGDAWKETYTLLQILYDAQQTHTPLIFPRTRWDFVKLGFMARKCRRRPRDQLFFFCLCLIMSLKNPSEIMRLVDNQ